MEACNGQVGCEPFVGPRIDTQSKGGVALPANKMILYPLKVMYGNEKYATGSTVYVAGEMRSAHWAAKIYELQGPVKFMMVPEAAVVLYDRPVPNYQKPLPTPRPSGA